MAGGTKLIAENRRARHDYHLLERYEAGIALTGTEVKSLRAGRADLARAFADVRDGEVWLMGAHIDEYAQGNIANHEPDRDRKLLLHRREIDSLLGKTRERGLTLVPTRIYFKDGKVKVEVALARGKEQRDKRRDIADRDAKRQVERALKERRLSFKVWGRPGFDVVGSPDELQAEVPGRPRKTTGNKASAKNDLALAA